MNNANKKSSCIKRISWINSRFYFSRWSRALSPHFTSCSQGTIGKHIIDSRNIKHHFKSIFPRKGWGRERENPIWIQCFYRTLKSNIPSLWRLCPLFLFIVFLVSSRSFAIYLGNDWRERERANIALNKQRAPCETHCLVPGHCDQRIRVIRSLARAARGHPRARLTKG